MSRKQLIALFVCHLVPWIIGTHIPLKFSVRAEFYSTKSSDNPLVILHLVNRQARFCFRQALFECYALDIQHNV